TVKEREGRAFPGARQCSAIREPVTPLHIGGRKRTQSARHLLERQVLEMPRFEVCDPAIESCIGDSAYLSCTSPRGISATSHRGAASRRCHLSTRPWCAPLCPCRARPQPSSWTRSSPWHRR